MNTRHSSRATTLAIALLAAAAATLAAGCSSASDAGDEDPVSSDEAVVAGHPTAFGLNPGSRETAALLKVYGKLPIGRVYNGTQPLSATCFQPGGLCYRGAALDVAGVTSSKRINMSVIFDPDGVTSASSPLAVELKNFAAAVPTGWHVQLVMFHEYNLHTTDNGGDGSSGATTASFVNAFHLLAQAINAGDAGRGRIFPVINPAWNGRHLADAAVPPASTMPRTQLHMDIYDNPYGIPRGYHNYGTTYANAGQFQSMYDYIDAHGYLAAGHGWGIDEFNAPRRVAPNLATLNTTYGWGPLSPHDIDGSGQAASITAMANWALTAPVPATTCILFTGQGNWNQYFDTAGTADQDAPVGSGLHQGWPIAVDPSKPVAAYHAFMDVSR